MKNKIIYLIPILLGSLFLIRSANAMLSPNDTANFIMTVTDVYGNPVQGNCTGYIYFPNMTLYKQLNLTYSNGLYYSNWTVPEVYGTYLEVGSCVYNLYGKTRTVRAYKTVYVSRSLNVLQQKLEEISNNATLNVTVNITGQIQNTTNQTLDKLDELMAVMFAFHSTPVTKAYCIDDYHLVTVKTATWDVGKWEIPVVKNETTYCQYGCDNRTLSCKPAPYQRESILLGIVIGIGILIYAIKRLMS